MDRQDAIDFIEVSEGVKESSAKRYLRYINGYVRRKRERDKLEKEAEPTFFKVIPKPKVAKRKPSLKGLMKIRLHYTHSYIFTCMTISPKDGRFRFRQEQHHFSYSSHSPFTSDRVAIQHHHQVYGENHQVVSLKHVRTYRPSFA